MPEIADNQVIEFLKPAMVGAQYNAGEVASFDAQTATALVEQEIAKPYAALKKVAASKGADKTE